MEAGFHKNYSDPTVNTEYEINYQQHKKHQFLQILNEQCLLISLQISQSIRTSNVPDLIPEERRI